MEFVLKDQHCFRQRLGTEEATSHCLKQWCPRLSMDIYVTKSRRSNLEVYMLRGVAINHRVTQGGSTEPRDAWLDDTGD